MNTFFLLFRNVNSKCFFPKTATRYPLMWIFTIIFFIQQKECHVTWWWFKNIYRQIRPNYIYLKDYVILGLQYRIHILVRGIKYCYKILVDQYKTSICKGTQKIQDSYFQDFHCVYLELKYTTSFIFMKYITSFIFMCYLVYR